MDNVIKNTNKIIVYIKYKCSFVNEWQVVFIMVYLLFWLLFY